MHIQAGPPDNGRVDNDGVLLSFNTWRATQPDAADSGLVLAANDHATRSCSLWWAGLETDYLRRIQAEARSRGITLVVHPAKYSKAELDAAVHLILAARRRLADLGFDLNGIGGPTPTFFGLVVRGSSLAQDDGERLPPHVLAAVRAELDALLRGAAVDPQDVRIELGTAHPLTA